MERQKELRYTLPKEYDVFCIGDLVCYESEGELNIPGNLYVSGSLDVFDLIVGGAAIIDDSIDAADITVCGGPCICGGDVTACNVEIHNGNFISDGDIDIGDITVRNGDCIVAHYINSYDINVDGVLDCYDVDSNGCPIHTAGYACQYYYDGI